MSATKVLYLLKKFPRLSETFILNELLAQEALGLPIHIISRRAPDNEPRHGQLANLRAPVEIMPDPTVLDPLTELFLAPGSEQLSLEKVRALVRTMQPYGHPRLTRLMGEALWLHRRTRELGITHVHVHFATESAVAAHLLHALGGPTYSITAHAKDIYRTTVNAKLLSRLIEHSAFTITVCDANVEHIRSMVDGAATAKLRRLYNGVDLQRFCPEHGSREFQTVLTVGRLVPKKGFDVFLETARELRSRGRDLQFIMIGDGEDRKRLELLASSMGLQDCLTMTGALEQGDVLAHMERSTLLCLPCLIGEDGNRDALPTVLLEALAAGLPTVSTPVTGIPEILDHGRVGLLVRERDPIATADAIDRLLEQPALRNQLARDGRAHAEKHFDSRKVAKTLYQWFAEAALPGGS